MFCLSGRTSVLSADFFPAIELGNGDWEIGLIDFLSYNNIPNVEEGKNNMIYFGNKSYSIPTGVYEIDDLRVKIKRGMAESNCPMISDEPIINEKQTNFQRTDNNTDETVTYEKTTHNRNQKTADYCKPPSFRLKHDVTTMRSWVYCSESIDFTKPNSIRSVLGFDSVILEPNKWHMSQRPIAISPINVIRIHCNIIRGSYSNGIEGHIIHEFFPKVEPGYKIIQIPNNVIYLPVNTKSIRNITISLLDQDSRQVNFQNEEISIRLHLRQRRKWD